MSPAVRKALLLSLPVGRVPPVSLQWVRMALERVALLWWAEAGVQLSSQGWRRALRSSLVTHKVAAESLLPSSLLSSALLHTARPALPWSLSVLRTALASR